MPRVNINNAEQEFDNVKIILPNGTSVAKTIEKDVSVAVASKVIVGAGSDKNYVHNQSVPSATWSVAHGLGKKVSVSVVDSTETVVYGDVQYIDDNNITITFTGAFAGKAFIN